MIVRAIPITHFFHVMTPGDEKALRQAFGFELNPALEDVRATPNAMGPEAEELMDRVRASIALQLNG